MDGGLNGTEPQFTIKQTRDIMQNAINRATDLFLAGKIGIKEMEPMYVMGHAVHYLDLYNELIEANMGDVANALPVTTPEAREGE